MLQDDHSIMWATRCMHESRSYDQNSFITLTYEDQQMPENRSISLRDFQLFMKRFRKSIKQKIKFFHCGEYSPKKTRPVGPFNPWEYIGEGERPHYHSIIFGYDFPDKTLFRLVAKRWHGSDCWWRLLQKKLLLRTLSSMRSLPAHSSAILEKTE